VRGIPVRVLIPNLITLLVLAAGLTAIRYAVEGRLDAFRDGDCRRRPAGRAGRAHRPPAQGRLAISARSSIHWPISSPSAAPPRWCSISGACNELSTFGWAAALSLAFAAALRLARFNVSIEDTTKPEWTKKFFTGVPAPAGAMLALLPINLYPLRSAALSRPFGDRRGLYGGGRRADGQPPADALGQGQERADPA
jgi:CDP-diacylglycerol--serine O-phosphatidyltransferase